METDFQLKSGSTLLKLIDGADYNIAESYLSGALNGVGSCCSWNLAEGLQLLLL